MGVRGLQSFLESHCGSACYNINLGKIPKLQFILGARVKKALKLQLEMELANGMSEEYQKKTGKTPLIVVDGMSCLRKLYGKLQWICGGQWIGYFEHTQNFIKKINATGIHLVFFFDGNTPERKRETWCTRRLENLKDVAHYFSIIKQNKELEAGKHFFIPTGLAAFTPSLLKDWFDCEVYTCLDECDKEVAEYAKKHGAMGILGQDSDYIIYNTAPYYFSSNHLNLETLETLVYDRAALSRHLHLTVDQLPLLSCLIGNDVIPQELLTIFHKQFLKESHGHRHHNRPPPEVLIPKVGSFISQQPPLEQILNNLPALSRTVFREDTMANALNDGIRMYVLDLTGPEKYFPVKKEELENVEIVERCYLRHMNSELGRHLYTILRGEPYESSTTLEDYISNLPSNAIIFRPLRAKIYRILQKSSKEDLSRVPEWCMYNGNTLKAPDLVEPEELPEGTPSLEELWDGTSELKWKTFLDCLHPKLHETKVRSLPDNFIAPVCLIFYLQCSQIRPILKDWEVGALLASFLSPIRNTASQVRSLNLPRIDSRAVHVATIFVKGLVNLNFLLSACDYPLSRKFCVPWAFFDGKIFHHFYLRAKNGARVEDLLEKKEALYKQYLLMKGLIQEHTPVPVITRSKSPNSPRDSPKKKSLSPSTSEVTATPPASPAHPPTTLSITKGATGTTPKSPNLSPASPRSSPHPTRHGGKSSKSSKSPAKSPKKSS